jgi:hypothetical protein
LNCNNSTTANGEYINSTYLLYLSIIYLSTVVALNIEYSLIITPPHISVLNDVLDGSLCLQLQLDVSSSFPTCIGPSRTLKIVKTSCKHCTMVQYLAPLRYLASTAHRQVQWPLAAPKRRGKTPTCIIKLQEVAFSSAFNLRSASAVCIYSSIHVFGVLFTYHLATNWFGTHTGGSRNSCLGHPRFTSLYFKLLSDDAGQLEILLLK